MNRLQKLCLATLFFSYYLISKVFPFNIGTFTKGGLVLGIMFPFIEKRLRVLITTVYQGFGFYNLFNVYKTARPAINPLIIKMFETPAPITTQFVSDGIISNTETVLIILYALYPQILGIMKIFTGMMVMASLLGVVMSGLNLMLSFTEPYSCYWLYKKLGLFKLIETHTGGRITIDDR